MQILIVHLHRLTQDLMAAHTTLVTPREGVTHGLETGIHRIDVVV